MLKGPLTLATFGLALNLFLWGIPGAFATSAAVHGILPSSTPTQADAFAALNGRSSLYPALLQLLGAEGEAFQVAGSALQQPIASDLVPRANVASAHVQDAAAAYVQAAQAVFGH